MGRARTACQRDVVAAVVLVTAIACGDSTAPGGTRDAGSTDAGAGDTGVVDADSAAHDSCVPQCETNACGVDDSCGGTCQCALGAACVGGVCGGCLGIAGDFCATNGPMDGSAAATCCGVGFTCTFEGDASRCCGVTGQGACVKDTDCCGFASGARCRPVQDASAGDSGGPPGVCG